MDHYSQHKIKSVTFGKEHIVKHTYPHRFLAKRLQRKNTQKNSFTKIQERNNDVVDHNSYPHEEGITATINSKRISFGDIFFCFIYIAVPKHFADKSGVVFGS